MQTKEEKEVKAAKLILEKLKNRYGAQVEDYENIRRSQCDGYQEWVNNFIAKNKAFKFAHPMNLPTINEDPNE